MTGLGMDFEDDFFFEEDKILTSDSTLSMNSSRLHNSSGSTLDKVSIVLPTVPSASIVLHQLAMMEDRIPDIELVAQDQCIQQKPINQMGMTITSGNVMIQKDASNLIGISIGGGAPLCPCLYIVQIFDNTPVALDGTLQAGDELVAVNGASVRGKSKVEVAKMIQSCDSQVKHRLVEGMGSTTADALGLSRAILCNDALVQRLMALKRTETFYRGLVTHAKATLHAFFDLTQIYKVFGDAFAAIGVREPQPRASEAFRQFGEQHRQMEKFGVTMLKTLKPILSDLGTYLNKAIPDTRLTISKYADAKFEYLSYCLKVKELDDEEQSCAALQEPLYRVETGNYEYRLVLRCRQEARARFAKLRSDVLVKLELLDNKHVQDVVWQLHKFAAGLAKYYASTRDLLSAVTLFPVEVDLSHSAFQYKSTGPQTLADSSDIEEYEPEEKQHNINEELLIDTSSFTSEPTDNT
ncbi:PRKCA-binding protein isoform X3 [Cataglyphis hispanica]|uniref:PRKCA-binding protein isoform X3 n=1 Tax=Cataglyphis hispanica TaxID=1086592 RepID=UPI0021807C14|nr:PRKCA-binding protein isoform X3 [Cataglyphis hispanica]